MSQEVIEITEREIEVIEVVEKGPAGPIGQAGPVGPQANINYTVVSSNQTLSNSQNIAADTSGGSFTLTLPESPNAGDSIDIFDYSETFDTNPLTIARNGQNIESIAEDLTANVKGAYFTLVYTGVTRGWQILPRYGISGIEDILSAEGDLLYRGASSETRLPIGTAGQVLKVNSSETAPEWGSISGSISVTGSDLTLSGATGTPITNATLATTGVGAGTYTKVTVDTKGRVTTGATATPADIGAAATSHTHAASDITSGTFDNARINFAAPAAIGDTTPAAGTFTTLTANNGTLTASAPALDISQTWNDSGTTFTGLQFVVTNTASSAASLVARLAVGSTNVFETTVEGNTRVRRVSPTSNLTTCFEIFRGTTSIFRVRDDGDVNVNASYAVGGAASVLINSAGVGVQSTGVFSFSNNTYGGNRDVILARDAAGVLAQRNGTNAQTFNIYNTYTSSTNYERGFLKWSSNVLQIGTEADGAGSARALEFQTDGTTRWTILATGDLQSTTHGVIARSVNVGRFAPADIAITSNAASIRLGSSADTSLIREGSGVLSQSSGATSQTFRIYNTSTSSNANFERLNLRWASNEFILDAEAGGTGTLRGIKIGSATSSLLSFYGVTPVDQPATVADPSGVTTDEDVEARTAINAIIDRLQELGLIAT